MTETKNTLGLINIIIFILTVYVLIALVVDMSFKLDPETSRLLGIIDNGICVIFLIEWLYRFSNEKWSMTFLKWGWIDLLASIPMIEPLRFGRIFRLIRIIRIIRAYKSMQLLVNQLFKNRAAGTFSSVSTMTLLLVIFSSIAILQTESVPEGNIKTAEDAIWWAYVTVYATGQLHVAYSGFLFKR